MRQSLGQSNKYYTPSIEEFYVGFEYEIEDLHDNLVDKIWRGVIFETQDELLITQSWIKNNEIRIKCLDSEDIESLGFEKINEYKFIKGDIKIYLDKHYIDILSQTSRIFIGTIKNKSELKKVLTMLGVEYGKL